MYTVICITLVVALIFQILLGDIPLHLFSFPVNVILLAALLAGTFATPIHPKRKWVAVLALFGKKEGALLTIVVMLVNLLALALVPTYYHATSWVFVASLLWLLYSLGLSIRRRIYGGLKVNIWRDVAFSLSHFGLWLMIATGVFGSADSHSLRVTSYKGVLTDCVEETKSNSHGEHTPYTLPFELSADSLYSTADNGNALRHCADITILNADSTTTHITTSTNAPASHQGYRIYLTDYDARHSSPEFVILEITRQPWKYLSLAGIVLIIAGCLVYALIKIR